MMTSRLREPRCPRCIGSVSQMYAASGPQTTTTASGRLRMDHDSVRDHHDRQRTSWTTTTASGRLLMDVETTVHFMSTAGQPSCPLSTSDDLPRPSNDLDEDDTSLTFTPQPLSDYWLTFRSSKHSDLPGQYQSEFRQSTAIDDVIDDDDCVRATEVEYGSLPRQPMSTNFSDVETCSYTEQCQSVV